MGQIPSQISYMNQIESYDIYVLSFFGVVLVWFDVRDPGDTSVRWINQMRIGNTDRRLNIAVAIIFQLLQKK